MPKPKPKFLGNKERGQRRRGVREAEIDQIQQSQQGLSNIGSPSNAVGFDAALILATEDPEIAVQTPGRAPAVGNNPIGEVVVRLNTPANDLDCMTASHAARFVLIDTTLVCEKVLIHRESGLNGTIVHDGGLDGAHTSGSDDRTLLDFVEFDGSAILAFGWAAGC